MGRSTATLQAPAAPKPTTVATRAPVHEGHRDTVEAIVVAFILALVLAPTVRADQPTMHQAKELVKQAADLLKVATADKGGHRVAALKALNDALAEINAGIEYDRTHSGPDENKRPR